MTPEPIFDLAHLGHIELLTPKPDESLKHAIQQTFFLYVYEPGGNRVEVANAGARLILAPDWKPIVWTEDERKKGQAWGLKTIESFHTHGTPPVAG
ncbi:MAG: catechol 2,3-dioxygenase [Bradyrhizobium sp.]|nr:catechol 2,3-dioxygenase [Bradyrhizobium sp.]